VCVELQAGLILNKIGDREVSSMDDRSVRDFIEQRRPLVLQFVYHIDAYAKCTEVEHDHHGHDPPSTRPARDLNTGMDLSQMRKYLEETGVDTWKVEQILLRMDSSGTLNKVDLESETADAALSHRIDDALSPLSTDVDELRALLDLVEERGLHTAPVNSLAQKVERLEISAGLDTSHRHSNGLEPKERGMTQLQKMAVAKQRLNSRKVDGPCIIMPWSDPCLIILSRYQLYWIRREGPNLPRLPRQLTPVGSPPRTPSPNSSGDWESMQTSGDWVSMQTELDAAAKSGRQRGYRQNNKPDRDRRASTGGGKSSSSRRRQSKAHIMYGVHK
jgi:hypothetical protein